MSIAEGTVDLMKEFAQPIEAVFAAWSNEEAQLVWGDPGEGWEMAFDQFRFAVGETDICRFGPVGGQQYVNENRYLAIEPWKRIVYSTSVHSKGSLSFAGTVVVTFHDANTGTQLKLVEHGIYFDPQDDVMDHRSGWESMLDALGKYLRHQR